jgi:DNA-binding transcriptional regulator YiaG
LNLKSEVFQKYEDKRLGIQGVYILDTISREFCPKCPDEQSIVIPNLGGLIAAVAVHRVKQPLKLSNQEIRFLRKACDLTARELAEKVQVRHETVSRWENGEETMSPQSEKVLRMIVGDLLADKAPGIEFDRKAIPPMRIEPISKRRLAMYFFAEHVNEDDQVSWNERKRFAYG